MCITPPPPKCRTKKTCRGIGVSMTIYMVLVDANVHVFIALFFFAVNGYELMTVDKKVPMRFPWQRVFPHVLYLYRDGSTNDMIIRKATSSRNFSCPCELLVCMYITDNNDKDLGNDGPNKFSWRRRDHTNAVRKGLERWFRERSSTGPCGHNPLFQVKLIPLILYLVILLPWLHLLGVLK